MKQLVKCKKTRYKTRVDALIAMANATRPTRHNDQNRPKSEKRAYLCPDCKCWHLTSRP